MAICVEFDKGLLGSSFAVEDGVDHSSFAGLTWL